MSDTPSNVTAPTEAMIRIADIEVGDRIRKLANMKLAKMEEIAASIAKIGLVQAITVSKHPTKEGIYILQAGMYRLEAHRHLKRAESGLSR